MLLSYAPSAPLLSQLSARKVFLIVLALAPLWWLSGFDFIVYPLAALLMVCLSPAPLLRLARIDVLFLLLIFLLLFSATLTVAEGADLGRVFAAYYNAALLMVGVVVMQQVRTWIAATTVEQELRALPIGRICAILLLLALVAVLFGRMQLLINGGILYEIPTLFGLVFTGNYTGLLAIAQTAQFVVPDWYGTAEPIMRAVVFSPYATAGAAVCAVFFHMAYLYAVRRGKPLWQIGLAVVFVLLLASVLTRAVIIGVILGALAGNLFFGDIRRQLVIFAGAVAAVAALAIGAIDVEGAASYRMGSTLGRLETYRVGMELVSNKSPIIGLGIKPRDESLLRIHIPVGSHSSVVSLYVKGGLIGLVLMLSAFVFYHALLWVRVWLMFRTDPRLAAQMGREARILVQLQFTLWIWMFYDDIDAPVLATVCAFMSFGYMQGWVLRLKKMQSDASLGRLGAPAESIA